MPKLIHAIPSYRKHKATGQAVVTLAGRDVYLGKHNTSASRNEYNRIIAEWTAHGGTLPQHQSNELSVVELAAAFMRHAGQYYRRPDGTPTNEVKNFKLAIRRLKLLYGRTRAADFGPLALKAIRQRMIDDGLARRTINQHTNRVRHIFKWGVENQLIEPSVLHGLQAVAGLRAGRSDAKETAPVRPVPDAFVDAVLPHVSLQVAAMIELQRITGMRSGEVCIMRAADIKLSGKVWVYTPATHKTAWHGHERNIYLGPKAQTIVRPFLKADLLAYLFSPADAEAHRNEGRFGIVSPDRKTKVYPCELRSRQRRRAARQRKPRRVLGDKYDPVGYYGAVCHGIESANRARLADAKAKGIDADKVELVPHWHPHQLRHNAATALRREHGIEVARIILGHRSAAITEVYAEVDHARAIDVMAKIG
jgi:integrase